MNLTKAECEAVEYAIKYYRDQATHNGETCGLHPQSIEYALLTSALEKIEQVGQ